MSESTKKKYFAASNSAQGFKNYYDSVFDVKKYSKIYIIKGGPGTGKSYFMKNVAEYAEELGFSVTYIYCSSDPNSLDGIIIEELKIAILDGTAPHACEASLPGAAENIVNLGEFWNTSVLSGSRKIIENLNSQKSKCFECGYRYLAAYKEVSDNMEQMITPFVKFDKIKKFAERFVSSLDYGSGSEEYRLINSIGMNGRVGFDTYRERSEIYYEINDYLETGFFLLRELCNELRYKSADMLLSPNPILPSRLDAISVLPNKLTFEINESDGEDLRVINMKRFVEAGEIVKIRSDFRAAMRLRDNILDMAALEFEKAKKYHFTIEEIYGAAMDFDAKEQFTSDFCKKIFDK